MANNASSRVSNHGNRRSTANSRVNAQRAHMRTFWYAYLMQLLRMRAPVNMIRYAQNQLR